MYTVNTAELKFVTRNSWVSLSVWNINKTGEISARIQRHKKLVEFQFYDSLTGIAIHKNMMDFIKKYDAWRYFHVNQNTCKINPAK